MAIECPRCKAANPDSNKFCGDCGEAQNSALSAVNQFIELSVRNQIQSIVAEQLESLSKRVDLIGEKLGFTPSSKVSASVRGEIETAFLSYQKYLQGLGYRPTRGRIEVDVRDDMDDPGAIAFYETDKQRMVINSKYAADAIVLYREYMHHVLYSAAPVKDYTDRFWAYYSIESALAWYLPCSFVGNPNPLPASWNLKKKRPFNQIRPEIGSAMSDGTEIWGSAFWEIRQALGQQTADRLVLDAWFKLRPENVLNDRGANFVRLLLESDKAQASQIREIFSRRGLAL